MGSRGIGLQSNPSENLLTSLQRTLAFFQMIEEGLRIYVGLAEELITAAVPYGVHLRPNTKALETASLGRLTQLFARYTRNDELVNRIPSYANIEITSRTQHFEELSKADSTKR